MHNNIPKAQRYPWLDRSLADRVSGALHQVNTLKSLFKLVTFELGDTVGSTVGPVDERSHKLYARCDVGQKTQQ